MATTDALTGAQNKRAFDQALATSILKAQADQLTLSLVIFDVDHFKNINDTHGHTAGDAVLRDLSALILKLCGNHRLFRVGGEEFCVLTEDLNLQQAGEFAESLRAAVENHRFSHQDTEITVTISAGLAELVPEELPKAFYQRADEKLYASKHAGRNQVSA
jgi:diguanylate cyclase (GGDEF)-like protein